MTLLVLAYVAGATTTGYLWGRFTGDHNDMRGVDNFDMSETLAPALALVPLWPLFLPVLLPRARRMRRLLNEQRAEDAARELDRQVEAARALLGGGR